jgi:hypothetical protein
MRARTKACDASVNVATPKRNGMRSRTGRSNSWSSATRKVGASFMVLESPDDAAQVADGAGRAARPVRQVGSPV